MQDTFLEMEAGRNSISRAASSQEALMLYRFGFIGYAASEPPRGDDTWMNLSKLWQRTEIGEFVIHSHPETPINYHSGRNKVVLIGHAFSVGLQTPADFVAYAAVATDREIVEWLNQLSGRFALLVLSDKGGKLFHDAFGARSIFYTLGGALAFGSHAQLLAHAFPAARRQDIGGFIDTAVHAAKSPLYLPGDATMFEGMYALVPNNYYDIGARKTVRYWPTHARNPTTFDDFFPALDQHFKALAEFLRPSWNPILGVTAGIDSRTVIAGLRRYGVHLCGATWLQYNLPLRELPTIEEIVRYLRIRHLYADGAGETGAIIASVAAENSGGFRKSSRIAAAMRDLYDDLVKPIFVKGHGGEIVRGFYNLRPRPMRDLSVVEMSRYYPHSTFREFRPTIAAAFAGFAERANYDDLPRWGYDPSDVFYWEHRMGMWGSAMLNELDAGVYSIAGFNSRPVYEAAFGLPNAERLTKKLLAEVIRRYDPGLAAIKYY